MTLSTVDHIDRHATLPLVASTDILSWNCFGYPAPLSNLMAYTHSFKYVAISRASELGLVGP